MKDFIKYVFATITGIVALFMLMGILFAISLVGMIASESGATKVKDNSVFVLQLNGVIQERTEEENPFAAILSKGEMDMMGLDDLLAAIEKAKNNDDIKGIYLEGGVTEFDSPATAQQLRDALKDFKKSGKWVVAYSDQYLQGAYYVASVADKIYLNKTGMVDFRGIGGKSEYLKGLFDKIGVRYQAVRVGKYKSAVERMTQSSMSDNDREQRLAYSQGIWDYWLKDISESRKVSASQLNQLANDSIISIANPADYVKARLIDKIMYPEQIKDEIKGRLKLDKDDDINQLTLADMKNVKAKKDDDGEKIAIYYAYGEIVDDIASMMPSGHNIVGKTTVDDLNELAKDDDIKAVVIRVNSPGGSAVASENIWHAIKQLKTKKPVVVSMGGLAASGGYMISAPANYIFAEPTTITGSIGIFGLVPNYSELATDKLGITFDGIKTNKYTDFAENLVLSKENSEEIRFLQTYVDRGYTTFLDIVAEGRKMKREDVHEIAQGRVWLAKDAVKIKLVDKLGSLNDAVKKAAELAKLDEYYTATYPAPDSWVDQFLPSENKGSYLDAELRSLLGDLYTPVMEMKKNTKRNRLQARLPYSVVIK
jgi:protease-4